MKRLNFRHPAYALPLIILPFLFLLNYLWLDMAQSPAAVELPTAPTETAALNTVLPEASLRKREVKDKFAAFQEEFRYKTDYSAVQEIGTDSKAPGGAAYGSVYSDEERRMLDSLSSRILSGQQPEGFMERVSRWQRPGPAPAMAAGHLPRPAGKVEPGHETEMRLFREQMRFIDSLSRAGEEPAAMPLAPAREPEQEAPLPVPVSTSPIRDEAFFNTVTAGAEEPLIRAILDEGLQVKEGGRIRIRLLEDIYAGEHQVRKDSYLYGTVSGFRAQRVEIAVRSILSGGQIIPVDLRVYDNDGLAGLYVPDSRFRDFTRELAGQVGSGQHLTLEDAPDNSSQLLYAMLEKTSQTAARTAGRAIRKNKARLKYNTIVYLIDNKAR